MPNEIEAKMKVADLAVIRARLKKLHAHPLGRKLETNVYFDTPRDKLRAEGSGLRIRSARDGSGRIHATITYKGKLQPGALKVREEIEFVIDNADAARSLLERLGLAVKLSFEKRRESWKLGTCKVELDEMPLLGTFVEIEAGSERKVMAARKLLGMAGEPLIRTGYAAMLGKLLRKRGSIGREIRFPRRLAKRKSTTIR